MLYQFIVLIKDMNLFPTGDYKVISVGSHFSDIADNGKEPSCERFIDHIQFITGPIIVGGSIIGNDLAIELHDMEETAGENM